MKRISTLLLSAALAFGAMGAAEAVELKASGYFDFAFGHVDSETFKDSNAGKGEDTFMAKQRVRTQFNFIASENLQGVVMFEIGDHYWGQSDVHGSNGARLDADGVNMETKRAYMDWTIPNTDTSVRMGIQGLALPTATGFGNPVFNADVAGIVTTTKASEMVDVTAFWLRPFDQASNDNDINDVNGNPLNNAADEMDMFGLVVPVKGDGWKVTPWAMYANIGNASGYYGYILPNAVGASKPITRIGNEGDSTGAWWLGTALNFQIIDNLTFATDIMYGKLNSVDIGGSNLGNNDLEASGWWMDAALNYKIEDFGTAGLFGWYSTGDSKDDGNELGRMPVVGVDGAVSFTSFGFAGSSNAFGTDNIVSSTATGTWGIGVKMADMSFVENLSHTLRFAYYEGTNNKNSSLASSVHAGAFKSDPTYLTTRDSAFEVNFDHKYQIYENLSAHLDLGYVALDMGKRNGVDNAPDDAWKAQVLFRYAF